MGAQCRCGTEVEFSFDQLGCIECGAACCPACSYQLESASYCCGLRREPARIAVGPA